MKRKFNWHSPIIVRKILIVPKLPDQASYYTRQLYVYNFTIVQSTSKNKLNKNTVFMYTRNESQAIKGSFQIASAVYNRLCNTEYDGYCTIRLFADGCGEQNKKFNSDFYAHAGCTIILHLT